MKFRLLFFAAFLSLMSCSGDDNSTDPVNENPNPQQPVDKDIHEVEVFNYNMPAAWPYRTVLTYENNKQVSTISYDQNNNVKHTSSSIYLASGSISQDITLFPNGSTEHIDSFEYDNEGRLTNLTRNGLEVYNMIEVTDYVYNNDNTITETEVYTINGNSRTKITTYYLNNGGLIYKVKEQTNNPNNYYTLIEYGNNNNISFVKDFNEVGAIHEISCNYNSLVVHGEYLNRQKNYYGGINNTILVSKGVEVERCAQNYISSYFQSNGQPGNLNVYYTVTYQYTFDADNYPVEEQKYEGGVLKRKAIITYQ